MSQPFYFSSCPSSSLHYSSAHPPRLFPSLPPSFTLALCEGHAIDFPLSIHFSVLFLKRGKQTKAIPPPYQRTQPPLPLIHTARTRRQHPPWEEPDPDSHSCTAVWEICIMTVPAQLIPANAITWTHTLNICVFCYSSVKTCVESTNHLQFILIWHWMC